MDSKEAYEKKIQAQLDEWDAEINRLKAKADKADAEARLEYYQKIDELRSLYKITAERLAELKVAGDEAWEDLKSGIDKAWESLDDAIKSAIARFR